MEKLLNTFLVILLFFISSSCIFDKIDRRELMIHNNSDEIIYAIISSNDSIYDIENYDDFIFKENCIYAKAGNIKSFCFTGIGSKKRLPSDGGTYKWDVFFESVENKKARLFIIQKDSVDKYGWKEIFKKNIYNKKYLFTIEDLDKINWQIEYKGE